MTLHLVFRPVLCFLCLSAAMRAQFPAVVHTTRRVMLMEFVDGVRINDVAGLRRLGLPAAAVSRLLAECYADQIFRHGFVHCDPHPGNVLVRAAADGRCVRLKKYRIISYVLFVFS